VTRQGWRPPPARRGPPFALIGVLLTLIVVLIVAILLVNGSGGPPTATPSPGATVIASPSIEPSGTLEVTVAPTLEVTPEITAPPTPSPTSAASLAPGATPKPTVTSLSGPAKASCTAPNGVAPAGFIHLTWTASNTTGVRISIDPPAVNNAYDAGYADYAWPAVSSADVPFACGKDSHLYVVTTIHAPNTYFSYRYMTVTRIP